MHQIIVLPLNSNVNRVKSENIIYILLSNFVRLCIRIQLVDWLVMVWCIAKTCWTKTLPKVKLVLFKKSFSSSSVRYFGLNWINYDLWKSWNSSLGSNKSGLRLIMVKPWQTCLNRGHKKALNIHRKKTHKAYSCADCDVIFDSKRDFKAHS